MAAQLKGLSWLLKGFANLFGYAIGKMVAALGIGYVVYTGLDTGIGKAQGYIEDLINGLGGPDFIGILISDSIEILNIGPAISIYFGGMASVAAIMTAKKFIQFRNSPGAS